MIRVTFVNSLHLRNGMSKDGRALENRSLHQSSEKAQEQLAPLQRGGRCPKCGQGSLDYDGLLNLSCPHCGYTNSAGGSYT
jgi:hypothetical protein